MGRDRLRAGLLVASLLAAGGCTGSTGAVLATLDERQVAVELVDVPFHPQTTDQCGPAALASVLNASGVGVDAASLKPQVYIPGREGSLQPELVAAVRLHGRIPYVIDGDAGSLVAELDAGRPVLVLQNLGNRALPVWHYAVVVGYYPETRRFVLRSGDRYRHEVGAKSFLRSWRRGEFWAFVALSPGELPARAAPGRYLRSVAALEATGRHADAAIAYRAATRAWPDNAMAWLGLGNAAYSSGALDEAAQSYRAAIEIEPQHAIAMNNLSQVYLELGCRDSALDTVEAALAVTGSDDPMRPHLQATFAEIAGSQSRPRCVTALR